MPALKTIIRYTLLSVILLIMVIFAAYVIGRSGILGLDFLIVILFSVLVTVAVRYVFKITR